MASKYTCEHTCGCTYASAKRSDRNKHERTRHVLCNGACPRYDSATPTFRIHTPETVAATLKPPTASSSRKRRRSISETPSVSSTSSGKRSREATIDVEVERVKHEKQRRAAVLGKLKVCCIFDPSRAATSYKSVDGDVCWVDVRLPGENAEVDQLLASDELRGFVLRHRKPHTVRMYDWAYVAYSALKQAGYMVEFRPWSSFSKMLVGCTAASVAKTLRDDGFDCVLGGIDLSLRPPSRNQAANDERNAFLALGEVFPIFPSPSGCAKHGAKVAFNEVLEQISRCMGMGRPKTERLVDLQNPPCGLVLKREFSDTLKDVHVPDQKKPEHVQVRLAKKFLKARTEAEPDAECLWLTQECVPFLAFGEFRFVCVGGVPMREIVTGRGPAIRSTGLHGLWSYETNDMLKTLADLQELVDQGQTLTEVNAFDSNRSTEEKNLAREKLHHFVIDFVSRLAALDGPNSSLLVFCRVDMSVFVDGDGKVSWYVNEVERGPTTCLWGQPGPGVVGNVGSDIAWPLGSWILREKERLSTR